MGCWPLVLKILLLVSLVDVGAAVLEKKNDRRSRREDMNRDAEIVTDAEPASGASSGNVLLVGYQPASSSSAPEPAESFSEPVNYAELCYLSNGGSSLTLTINEATQVGSVVGSVEVNGNPAPDASGNVDLVDVLPSVSGGIVVTAAPQRAPSSPNGSLEANSEVNVDWSSRAGHLTRRRLLSRRSTGAVVDTENSESVPTTSSSSTTMLDSPAGGPPVRLEPGTKNLVLVRALDRELLDGEQSPVLQVSCIPRLRASNSEAATTIPVRLLVTDANDHAPEFLGLPYVLNISETSHIGQVVSRNILATDRDSAGPFSTIHYKVLDDGQPQSQLLQFANPLEPVLVVAAPLDYESLASFTITLVAQDQGEPEPLSSSVQVQVNVLDFDDQNPRFLDDKYTLIMDESQRTLVGQNLKVLPRNLHAEDGDRGINAAILYSFDLPASSQQSPGAGVNPRLGKSSQLTRQLLDELKVDHYLHLNPSTGEVRLIRQWPSRWAAAPMTLVVRATQADNRDRYTLTTLTISASGSSAHQAAQPKQGNESQEEPVEGAGSELAIDDASASASEATNQASASNKQPGALKQGIEFQNEWLNITVPESVSINEKVARVRAHLYLNAVTTTPPLAESEAEVPVELVTGAPDHKPINYQILDDQHDQWSINGLGEILVKRPLDYEQRRQYSFLVLATYTKYSDICRVQVNVLNVNDNKPKFTQPHYTFHLTESRLRNNLIGSVQAHDSDLNDSIQYSLVGGEHAHLFDISPSTGQIRLKPSTKSLQSNSCQLIVQASDTLGSKARYSHQARVQIQVAAHLLGPQVDLSQVAAGAGAAADTPVDLIHHDARLFNSRSLLQQRPPDYRGAHQQPHRQLKEAANHEPAPVNQAPTYQQRSSVATVMSSMQHMLRGAGFLDMPWASALLLSALLAFMICLLLILIVTMTVHLYRRHSKAGRQRQQLAAASNRIRQVHMNAGLPPPTGPQGGSSSSSSSRFLSHSSRGSAGEDGLNGGSSLGARLSISGTPQLHLSPSASNIQHHQSMSLQTDYTLSSLTRQQPQNRRPNIPGIPPAPKDVASARDGHATGSQLSSPTRAHHRPLKLNIEAASVPQQISSLSSQSKRSYRSNSTDDSSVIHCGHYSVNSPHPQPLNTQATASVSFQLDPSDLSDTQYPRKQAGSGHLQAGELAGCKAYRKLPHLGSLVRPARCRVAPAPESSIKLCIADTNAAEESATQTDSAIVSDGSSSSGGAGLGKGHLMALVRSAESRTQGSHLFQSSDRIKWPLEAAPPQRVKRLTWDDQADASRPMIQGEKEEVEEDSTTGQLEGDEDCFIAPDIHLEGPISPLSNHQYPIQGTTDARGHQYAEQHFLFSTPCSPVASNLSLDHHRLPTPVHNQSVLDSARDNCLDYTFVQSSQQFGMDTGNTSQKQQHQQQSLSAQHHLLQLQLLQHHKNVFPNYLYSNRNNHNNPGDSPATASNQALVRNQDLRLLTTAAI